MSLQSLLGLLALFNRDRDFLRQAPIVIDNAHSVHCLLNDKQRIIQSKRMTADLYDRLVETEHPPVLQQRQDTTTQDFQSFSSSSSSSSSSQGSAQTHRNSSGEHIQDTSSESTTSSLHASDADKEELSSSID